MLPLSQAHPVQRAAYPDAQSTNPFLPSHCSQFSGGVDFVGLPIADGYAVVAARISAGRGDLLDILHALDRQLYLAVCIGAVSGFT